MGLTLETTAGQARRTETTPGDPQVDAQSRQPAVTAAQSVTDTVERKPVATPANDAVPTTASPDVPAPPATRFSTTTDGPARARALDADIGAARQRLTEAGLSVDDSAPTVQLRATLTRDRSWRDVAASAFGVAPDAVTARHYQLLAGGNPELAQLLSRGSDPAATFARSGSSVILDHSSEGGRLRGMLLEGQGIAIAGSRAEYARESAAGNEESRALVGATDQLLVSTELALRVTELHTSYARFSNQLAEAERRATTAQPGTGRVPLTEARRELDALLTRAGDLSPAFAATLSRHVVDLAVLEARTFEPPPLRGTGRGGVPQSVRDRVATSGFNAALDRGRETIADMERRGAITPADASALRHRLDIDGADARAEFLTRRGDTAGVRSAYVDQIAAATSLPRAQVDEALRAAEPAGWMPYVFSSPPSQALRTELSRTINALPDDRRNEAIRGLTRLATAAADSDDDAVVRGAVRMLDIEASTRNDGALWSQTRAIVARHEALRGNLDAANHELGEAVRYAGAIANPDQRQAWVQELREQHAGLQVQLASGAGSYGQRRPAAIEARRIRERAESDPATSPDHRARLLMMEARAYLESNQGAEARSTLTRLAGMGNDVAWASERAREALRNHSQDDAGLRVALRELSSESLGEVAAYTGGGAAAGAAIGAGLGVWLGGVGAIPAAAVGALIGSAVGTTALKTRNAVRAYRHGAFDSNVVGGMSSATGGETALNAVSLGFDLLGIAAPLKAAGTLGRTGIRALMAPGRAELTHLTGRLDADIASAIASSRGTIDSLPEGARRAALEGQVRELLIRQFSRDTLRVGGRPAAAAGVAALVGPVAQQIAEIEGSTTMSPAEKARARQQVLSHVAQAGLVVGLFGGSQALIGRYAASPGSVAARLREGLPVDAQSRPIAVGRADVPERGFYEPLADHAIASPDGAFRVDRGSNRAIVDGGLYEVLREESAGADNLFVLRAVGDPDGPTTIVQRRNDTWSRLQLEPGHAVPFNGGEQHIIRDSGGETYLVANNGLARRIDAGNDRVPGRDPARSADYPGFVDIDGDRFRFRARIDGNDPFARELFTDTRIALGRHEGPDGPVWVGEHGLIDGDGRVLRFSGRSESQNANVYVDSSGRRVAMRIDFLAPQGQRVLRVDPATVVGQADYVAGFNMRTGTGHDPALSREGNYATTQRAASRATRLTDIPERVVRGDPENLGLSDDAMARFDALMTQRNPTPAQWTAPDGRVYTTLRENGQAYAFDERGLPVGTLTPDASGALRFTGLDTTRGSPVTGVGRNAGRPFHVRQGPNGPEVLRVVDGFGDTTIVLDGNERAHIMRGGQLTSEGVFGTPGNYRFLVRDGSLYRVGSNVDANTVMVTRQRYAMDDVLHDAEVRAARIENGRIVMDPPGVTGRIMQNGSSRIVHDGQAYDVLSEPQTRAQYLANLPNALRYPGARNASTRRTVEALRAELQPRRGSADALAEEVAAGRGPILDRLGAALGRDPLAAIQELIPYTPADTTPLIVARRLRPGAVNANTSDPHAHAFFINDNGRVRPARIDEVRADFDRRVGTAPPRRFADLPRAQALDISTPAADGTRTITVRDRGTTHTITVGARPPEHASALPSDADLLRWLQATPVEALREIRTIALEPPSSSAIATWRYGNGTMTYHAGNHANGVSNTIHEAAGHGIESGDPRVRDLLLQARMLDLHAHGQRHGTVDNYGDTNTAELFAVAVEEWAAGAPGANNQHLRRVLDSMFSRDGQPLTSPEARFRMHRLLPYLLAAAAASAGATSLDNRR